jgi:geranylgeranyl pyrophosphate synthase
MKKNIKESSDYLLHYTQNIKKFHQDQKRKKSELIDNFYLQGKSFSEIQVHLLDEENKIKIKQHIDSLQSDQSYQKHKSLYHNHTKEIRQFVNTLYETDYIENNFSNLFRSIKDISLSNNIDTQFLEQNMTSLLERIKYVPKEDMLEAI